LASKADRSLISVNDRQNSSIWRARPMAFPNRTMSDTPGETSEYRDGLLYTGEIASLRLP
jgi:hypothetical protein